jgi:hypothetical protein
LESGTNQAGGDLEIAGQRISVKTVTFRGAKEPRLRFDRVAVGLVKRLQRALSKSVPGRNTVVVTVTAPIRQDSKTTVELEEAIRGLLAARRSQLKTSIHGNRIGVRVLKGGGPRIPKVVGFVHNPEPDPEVLVDVTRKLLMCMGSGKRAATGGCWLVIANQDRLAPLRTVWQVCSALRAWAVFTRIVIVESKGVRVLLRAGG